MAVLPAPLLHRLAERECLGAAPPRCLVSRNCNPQSLPNPGASSEFEGLPTASHQNVGRDTDRLRCGICKLATNVGSCQIWWRIARWVAKQAKKSGTCPKTAHEFRC